MYLLFTHEQLFENFSSCSFSLLKRIEIVASKHKEESMKYKDHNEHKIHLRTKYFDKRQLK